MDDFTLSEQKIGGCYIGVHTVLTNIFGGRKVLAYVTSAEKGSGSRRFYIRSEGIQKLGATNRKSSSHYAVT